MKLSIKSAEIVNKVRSIILKLEQQPHVFPTGNESIQMEYEKDNGDYLEFELFEDEKLKMFFLSASGRIKTDYVSLDHINEIIKDFYESESF